MILYVFTLSTSPARLRGRVAGGWPGLSVIRTRPTKWVPHSSRSVRRVGAMPHAAPILTLPKSVLQTASYPPLPTTQGRGTHPYRSCRQLKAWATRPLRLLMLILSIRKNLHFHLVGFSILLYVLNRRRWRIAQFSVLHVLGWASYSVYPEDCCPRR